MAQQCLSKAFDANMFRVLSQSRWNINGSCVCHSQGLPLVLKAKVRYSSELVVPGFFKACGVRGLGSGRKRPYILAKARRTCRHEDHTDALSEQFSAAQSTWQDRFFPNFRHIQCRLFLLIAFLHTHTQKTQMTMTEHLHKLANTGMRAVDILSAR